MWHEDKQAAMQVGIWIAEPNGSPWPFAVAALRLVSWDGVDGVDVVDVNWLGLTESGRHRR